MQLAIATQRVEVGELKINRAFISSLDWIILRRASLKRWVTTNLGLVDETLSEFRSVMRQIKRMGPITGVRPCITLMGDEVTLRSVPGSDSLPETVTLVSPETKGDQWLKTLFETYPEIEEEIKSGAWKSLRSLTDDDNFKIIVKDLDGTFIDRRDTDYRYVSLKQYWDNLHTEKSGSV